MSEKKKMSDAPGSPAALHKPTTTFPHGPTPNDGSAKKPDPRGKLRVIDHEAAAHIDPKKWKESLDYVRNKEKLPYPMLWPED